MKRRIAEFAVLAVALSLSIGPAFGQATGTILGQIKDITESVVSGATVTITEQNTAVTRSVKSDESGRYAANLMPVGQYTIEVDYAGFQQAIEKNVRLEVQGTREVDFTLTPATVKQGVTVTATPVEVQ